MFDTMKAKLVGAGVGLALVGTAVTGVAFTTAAGAQTPPANPPAATQPADTTPEAPDSAVEAPEANEPALPGGGHADPAGVDVQNDFEGVQ